MPSFFALVIVFVMSAPALARPMAFAFDCCARARYDEKSGASSGWRARPMSSPPFAVTISVGVVTETVGDRNEKPGLGATVDERRAERMSNRIGVEDIMDRCRGARLVRQPLRAGSAQRDDLVAGVADPLHDERLRRTADIEDRIDALVLEPVARNRGGPVGAVVVILDEQLDRRAEHLFAEVVHCHFAGGGAPLSGIRGIGTGQVEDQPDPDD